METIKFLSSVRGSVAEDTCGALQEHPVDVSRSIVQKVIQYSSALKLSCPERVNMQTLANRMAERQALLEELRGKGLISSDGVTETVTTILQMGEEFGKLHKSMLQDLFEGALRSC
jgi:hypothetical protein